jgi:soluble lytic murein transglycosylase|tara:strand:- start:736 stop:2706 length:1971 start_codon:yes stop_codon:yes gene_type:complete
MQVKSRFVAILTLIFALAAPAVAERPRPLGWAMDAMRAGNWQNAAAIAQRDGNVAADIIEWHRLRAGRGDYAEVAAFLSRRPDWPGEAYLRRKSEDAVINAGRSAVLSFFAERTPQTARGVLAYAKAKTAQGEQGEADVSIVLAWRTMRMNDTSHAAFIASHNDLLKPHHNARLSNMLWEGAATDARRMLDLVPADQVALARARLALQHLNKDVNGLIDAVPAALRTDAGLQYDRFTWRARKGRSADAKTLLRDQSTSAEALGSPQAWSNRRRSLARDEMRDGDPKLAYQLASRHFLTTGSAYADLEWLSGYIALRKLNDPTTALGHFLRFDKAILSPISKGRAGYWIGRAYDALNDPAQADQAYTNAAQQQTSFYGLLAAERAGLAFDLGLVADDPMPDWRGSDMVKDPLFEAGLLLQASGELDVAERFWTHYAERLDLHQAGQLGRAAIDVSQPHLAVMIGKRLAQRAIVLPEPYYALHPAAYRNLPMAPEMVLAIARRESEFDPKVQSGVGARGLMQIMPATANEVAAGLGRSGEHTTARLTTDPEYNADLGAAFLSTLAGRFDGNIVMMSAAYNAGPSRPIRWAEMYGDPRGQVDVVDWIEHIPFRETRNYVMRVTESLPIYRARLGKTPLPIRFTEELKGSTLLSFAPKGE